MIVKSSNTRLIFCLSTALLYGAAAPVLGQSAGDSVTPDGVAPPSIEADYARPPGEGGVRRWQMRPDADSRLFAEPSIGSRILTTLDSGAILSSFGCTVPGTTRPASDDTGALWCRVRPFRGGPRGFLPASNLAPALGPDGAPILGRDDSKRRARKRDFDGQGTAPCAQERGQDLGECSIGVARGTGGDATVAATFPNGFVRYLFFKHGEFISASATMSGVGTDKDWLLEDGVHQIRVDDQRFLLDDALVFGK